MYSSQAFVQRRLQDLHLDLYYPLGRWPLDWGDAAYTKASYSAPGGDRTRDNLIKSQILYQLSYQSISNSTPPRNRTALSRLRAGCITIYACEACSGTDRTRTGNLPVMVGCFCFKLRSRSSQIVVNPIASFLEPDEPQHPGDWVCDHVVTEVTQAADHVKPSWT